MGDSLMITPRVATWCSGQGARLQQSCFLCADSCVCYVLLCSVYYVRMFSLCNVRIFGQCYVRSFRLGYVRTLGAGLPLHGSPIALLWDDQCKQLVIECLLQITCTFVLFL